MYPMFFDISSWGSTSKADPNDVSKKWANSISEGLAAPSAMLLLIETDALCNWSQRPFFSNSWSSERHQACLFAQVVTRVNIVNHGISAVTLYTLDA